MDCLETALFTSAQSVDDFCKSNGISRSFFYKLHREGKAPRIMKVGRRTLISAESAMEWRKSLETPRGHPVPQPLSSF
jgi:predicted DNA-binding transcriptional regulator AlpA